MRTVAVENEPNLVRELAAAAERISTSWQLTPDELLAILGVPPASLASCRLEDLPVEQASRLLTLFAELRSRLEANDTAARQWLRTPNTDLGVAPITLMGTHDGLRQVLAAACRVPPAESAMLSRMRRQWHTH